VDEITHFILNCFPKLAKARSVGCNFLSRFGANEAFSEIFFGDLDRLKIFIENQDNLSFAEIFWLWCDTPSRAWPRFIPFCVANLGSSPYFLHILTTVSSLLPTEFRTPVIEGTLSFLQEAKFKREYLGKATGLLVSLLDCITEREKFTLRLLNVAFSSDDDSTTSQLLDRCIGKLDADSLNFLAKLLDIRIDRWNYSPAAHGPSIPGKLGLRNLGSTCYMNAVFQQLFWTLPFRYRLISKELTEESQRALQRVFTELIVGRTRFADPAPFIGCWKGWGKALVNPREQQDAAEFFQMILDQLPDDLDSLFKGCISHTIEDLGGTLLSQNEEPFYAIGLDITGHDDLRDCLESFIQRERFIGAEQYEFNSQKIDAQAFARILSAPDVLVLQLKRFAFDLATQRRRKLNTRLVFPKSLDLGPYLANPGTQNYQLTGVVLHSGIAQSGHYTSLVSLDGEWIRFDDMEVSVVTEAEFESLVYGDGAPVANEFDLQHSAYLLFYTKDSATYQTDDRSERSFREGVEMDSKCDANVVAEIKRANCEHLRTQALFSGAAFNLFQSIEDPEIVVKYFFNVFCHSALGGYVSSFRPTLQKLLEFPNGVQHVLGYCRRRWDDLRPIFLYCSDADIMGLFTDFFSRVLEGAPSELSFPLLKLTFELLPLGLATAWRQVTKIGEAILPSIRSQPSLRELALQDNWPDALQTFVATVYDGSRSAMVLQNIDLSPILGIMVCLSDSGFASILQFTKGIVQSPVNCPVFAKLLGKLWQSQSITFSEYLDALGCLNGSADDSVGAAITQALSDCPDAAAVDSLVQRIAQSPQTVSMILSKLLDPQHLAGRALFSKFPHVSLFKFLFSDSIAVRTDALALGRAICSGHPAASIRLHLSLLARIREIPQLQEVLEPWDGYSCLNYDSIGLREGFALLKKTGSPAPLEDYLSIFNKLPAIVSAAADPIRLAMIRLLGRYDPSAVKPHFSTIYATAMQSSEPAARTEYWRVFVAFQGMIHWKAADIPFMLAHHSMELILRDIKYWMGKPIFELLLTRLTEAQDSVLCQQVLGKMMESIGAKGEAKPTAVIAKLIRVAADSMTWRSLDSCFQASWEALDQRQAGISGAIEVLMAIYDTPSVSVRLDALDGAQLTVLLNLFPDSFLTPTVIKSLSGLCIKVAQFGGERHLSRVLQVSKTGFLEQVFPSYATLLMLSLQAKFPHRGDVVCEAAKAVDEVAQSCRANDVTAAFLSAILAWDDTKGRDWVKSFWQRILKLGVSYYIDLASLFQKLQPFVTFDEVAKIMEPGFSRPLLGADD
jgi:hypothetical protein